MRRQLWRHCLPNLRIIRLHCLQTVTKIGITLSAGRKVMRIVIDDTAGGTYPPASILALRISVARMLYCSRLGLCCPREALR